MLLINCHIQHPNQIWIKFPKIYTCAPIIFFSKSNLLNSICNKCKIIQFQNFLLCLVNHFSKIYNKSKITMVQTRDHCCFFWDEHKLLGEQCVRECARLATFEIQDSSALLWKILRSAVDDLWSTICRNALSLQGSWSTMGNRLSERRTSQKFAKQVIATLSLDDIANTCLFLFVLFVYFISSWFYYFTRLFLFFNYVDQPFC